MPVLTGTDALKEAGIGKGGVKTGASVQIHQVARKELFPERLEDMQVPSAPGNPQ